MHHLMSKKIAVNTKVILARCAFVATAHTHPLCVAFGTLPLLLQRDGRECDSTGKTRRASRGTIPWDVHPVHQRE